MDIQSPGYWSQLCFLNGKVDIRISEIRRCSRCLKVLEGGSGLIRGVPIALCKSCSDEIYYGYYGCLANVMERALATGLENDFQKDIKLEKLERIDNVAKLENFTSMVACTDLLHPDCEFPTDPERLNPCLKNHGIGLIIFSPTKIGVLIGSVDSLKYQMIWRGGIYGMILGYSDKIMNVEFLEKALNFFIPAIKTLFREMEKYLEKKSIELISAMDFENTHSTSNINQYLGRLWMFLMVFHYYKDYYSKKMVNTILMRCICLIEAISKEIIGKIEPSLEIREIFELYKMGNPLNSELRSYLENTIGNSFIGGDMKKIEGMKEISRMIVKDVENFWSGIGTIIRRIEDAIDIIAIDQVEADLVIQEVLESVGPFLIVNCNLSEKPSFIQINDLIGQEIKLNYENNDSIARE